MSQWVRWLLKSSASRLFAQPFVHVQIRKHQSSASLCEGNHRSPVDSRHKGPITRKMFLFDDVIMLFLPVTAVEGHVEWTVEDAVEHLGFGWFQIRFVIICGLLTVSHDVMIWSIFFYWVSNLLCHHLRPAYSKLGCHNVVHIEFGLC